MGQTGGGAKANGGANQMGRRVKKPPGRKLGVPDFLTFFLHYFFLAMSPNKANVFVSLTVVWEIIFGIYLWLC